MYEKITMKDNPEGGWVGGGGVHGTLSGLPDYSEFDLWVAV